MIEWSFVARDVSYLVATSSVFLVGGQGTRKADTTGWSQTFTDLLAWTMVLAASLVQGCTKKYLAYIQPSFSFQTGFWALACRLSWCLLNTVCLDKKAGTEGIYKERGCPDGVNRTNNRTPNRLNAIEHNWIIIYDSTIAIRLSNAIEFQLNTRRT